MWYGPLHSWYTVYGQQIPINIALDGLCKKRLGRERRKGLTCTAVVIAHNAAYRNPSPTVAAACWQLEGTGAPGCQWCSILFHKLQICAEEFGTVSEWPSDLLPSSSRKRLDRLQTWLWPRFSKATVSTTNQSKRSCFLRHSISAPALAPSSLCFVGTTSCVVVQ